MAWRPCSRPTDAASTHVLEAMILASILFGAAYSVTVMRDGSGVTARPREKLEALAEDALIVLEGLSEARGTFLELFLTEGYHCSIELQTAVDAEACLGVRSANLSLKIESYLPDGAGYAYGVGNGVAQRVLYRSYLPEGETVVASRALVPDWNLTFMAPEMSCYEAGMDVTILSVPLWHGALATPLELNHTASGAPNATAAEDGDSGVWRATLPAASRGAAATVVADANATDGTYPGATEYASCDLAGTGAALVAALRASTFDVTAVAPVGGVATITFDLTGLGAVAGIAPLFANVTFFDPVPPHGPNPDAYVPLATVALPALTDGTLAWTVPPESLYGAHPALLTVTARVPSGALVELHRIEILQVALPSGEVPIDPPYRVFLQAWFPDW